MAQQPYRANLSSAVFPLTLAKAGRTVVNPKTDQNFDRRVDPEGSQRDAGIPQVIFLENVLPTSNGYQSVIHTGVSGVVIPSTHRITAMPPIKLATSITTTSGPTAVSITDSGATLTDWVKSSTFTYISSPGMSGDGTFTYNATQLDWINGSEVYTSTSIGNPVNSYALAHMEGTGWTGAHNPAFIYRNASTLGATQYDLVAQIRFRTGTSNTPAGVPVFRKIFTAGICNSLAGVGLKLHFDSSVGANGTLSICTNSEWGDTSLTTLASVVLGSALAYDTWYRLVCSVTVNTGTGQITVTAAITTTVPATLGTITTLIASGVVTIDNYTGFVHQSHPTEWATVAELAAFTYPLVNPNRVYVDNITITATVPNPATYTKASGVIDAVVAFFSNNTASWSTTTVISGYVDSTVTLPGGFTSPLYPWGVSTASVRGVSYVCVIGSGSTPAIYSLSISGTTITFTDITATILAGMGAGFVATDIIGITSSYNYLIVYTAGSVFWSSTTTPTDFAASLVNGAGAETPGNLKGDITFCKEHLAGFFIYSEGNVLFATYTGNARYPWKFREVGNSGGYTYSTQISGDTNTSVHMGVNNAKLIQQLDPNQATNIAPEVTEFYERVRAYDIYNYSTDVFTLDTGIIFADEAGAREVPLWFFLDRYILVPFGYTTASPTTAFGTYRYVWVFDTLLRRYGRLKVLFSHAYQSDSHIFFVNASSGTVKYLDFNLANQGSGEAMLLLGKLEHARGDMITLEQVECESSIYVPTEDASSNAAITLLPSYDGKKFDTSIPLTLDVASTGNLFLAWAHNTSQNFSIAVKGRFDLCTMQIRYQPNEGDW